MKGKIFIFSFLSFFLLSVFSSCSKDGEEEYVAVEEIFLKEANVESHMIGEQFHIEPIITPANATNKDITYLPFNKNVVTVDASGLVTVVGEGLAIIQVTTVDGGKKAYFQIKVKLAEKTQDSEMTMYYDETKQFVSSIIPAGCQITISNIKLQTYYDNSITERDVVSIDKDCVIRAKLPGVIKFVAMADKLDTHFAENVTLNILARPLSREQARAMLTGKGYEETGVRSFKLYGSSWSYAYYGSNTHEYVSGNDWDVSDSDGDGDYSSGKVVCTGGKGYGYNSTESWNIEGRVISQYYKYLTPQSVLW